MTVFKFNLPEFARNELPKLNPDLFANSYPKYRNRMKSFKKTLQTVNRAILVSHFLSFLFGIFAENITRSQNFSYMRATMYYFATAAFIQTTNSQIFIKDLSEEIFEVVDLVELHYMTLIAV